ncbi:glycoside hydrolase domain-containing protein [Bacteroides ovatus]|uniref:glycoside hydrolase domain-containing protein n=1 Tax=Bacteroides ovatus TaxID=28116 RepID=UPI0012AC2F2D|nr:glycoside hydrolase domain-containing protein [Bacteroides ovatus]
MKNILSFTLILFISIACFSQNEKYVNMFLGSSGDHGQMTPGAAVPFGMISVCPDCYPNQHGGYDYEINTISGISINRISGVGCHGTGSNIRVNPTFLNDTIKIIKGTENAHPGYYETLFSNGVKGMFTATRNMAVEKFVYPSDVDKVLSVDFSSSVDDRKVLCKWKKESNTKISGWVIAPTACARGVYKLWYSFEVNTPFDIIYEDAEYVTLKFDKNIKDIELRISVSPVDQKCADEIADSWSNQNFSNIHKSAKKQWKEVLNKIKVKGSTEEQRNLFYTLLYRTYLSPMETSSLDGKYKGTDGKIYSADKFKYYSSWSMWDTFRTKFPLLVITEPEKMRDICWSLADIFRTGKKNWATDHESVPTVRTEHSIIMLLDSYLKGIEGDYLSHAFEGMEKEIATNLPMKTPDQKLESSYDIWAIAKIADILGKEDKAKLYSNWADSLFYDVWTKEFMTITPQFTLMKNNGLYQGSKWQYRWAAPHYLNKMIELVGKEELRKQLEYFFDTNLFNQGNEPDIHTPYIFNALGTPYTSQKIVRELLTKEDMVHLYGGNAEYPKPFIGRAFQNKVDGFAPEMDEDDGTMSAWYIFSSIGIYPMVVGSDKYEVVSPLYDKITIKSGNNIITIKTKGRKSPNDPIKNIIIDGYKITGNTISHNIFKSSSEIMIEY